MSHDNDSEVLPLSEDTDEEIEEWVSKHRKWELLDQWQRYVLASRQSYFNERQYSLGSEYFSRPQDWDMIFEREWAIVEERMNAGIGVSDDILSDFGEDFFKDKEALLEELKVIYPTQEIETDSRGRMTIYSFEDFIMLSNQGIFRDEIFLIDPERKWRKKVEEILHQYGFTNIERMSIDGENYLVVTR